MIRRFHSNLLLMTILCSAASGCGGGETVRHDDPRDVVHAYYEAAERGDCTAVERLQSTQKRRTSQCWLQLRTARSRGFPLFTTVEDLVILSDEADRVVVEVALSAATGEETTLQLDLVREEGKWLVDGISGASEA